MKNDNYSYSPVLRNVPIRIISIRVLSKKNKWIEKSKISFKEPRNDLDLEDIVNIISSSGVELENETKLPGVQLVEVSGKTEFVLFNSLIHDYVRFMLASDIISVIDKNDRFYRTIYGRNNNTFESSAFFVKGMLGKENKGIKTVKKRPLCSEDNNLNVLDIKCNDGAEYSVACYTINDMDFYSYE